MHSQKAHEHLISSMMIATMNAKCSAIIHAFVAISFLGIALSPVTPALANSCRSTQTIGSIDFGDCKSTTLVGGSSISIEKYRVRQVAQFEVALAGYNNTFAANIAQLPVKRTMSAWKLQNGELQLYSLALKSPSNFISAASRLGGLAEDNEYFKDF
ncbi:MAG TPA: hypothetical protein V6D48_09625 [Oculatellaceae cyanobacterium]